MPSASHESIDSIDSIDSIGSPLTIHRCQTGAWPKTRNTPLLPLPSNFQQLRVCDTESARVTPLSSAAETHLARAQNMHHHCRLFLVQATRIRHGRRDPFLTACLMSVYEYYEYSYCQQGWFLDACNRAPPLTPCVLCLTPRVSAPSAPSTSSPSFCTPPSGANSIPTVNNNIPLSMAPAR